MAVTRWLVEWVGPRTGLDVVQNSKLYSRTGNPTLAVQPVALLAKLPDSEQFAFLNFASDILSKRHMNGKGERNIEFSSLCFHWSRASSGLSEFCSSLFRCHNVMGLMGL
jgi:hypothetical protein